MTQGTKKYGLKTGLPHGDELSDNKGFGYLPILLPLPVFREPSVPVEKNASALLERRRFSFDASERPGRDRQGAEIDKRRNWRPPEETAASVT